MKINERMERGKRGKALAGKLVGHGPLQAPYGYRYAGEKRSYLALVEDEATIVRDIAHWYLEGTRLQEICDRLTNMGLPSPGDTRRMPKVKQRGYGVWGVSTLYRILRNQMYAGTYLAFRYTSNGHRRVSLDNTCFRLLKWEPCDHLVGGHCAGLRALRRMHWIAEQDAEKQRLP
jgi:hypothetical protein